MKHSRAGTTSSPGRPLREPLEPAAFHREYAQPVAAKIRSQHAPAAGVEKQTVRMRRTLQLRIASTTCVLENSGRLAQAANRPLFSRTQVVEAIRNCKVRRILTVCFSTPAAGACWLLILAATG